MTSHRFASLASLTALALIVSACSSPADPPADLPSFQDVNTAPAAIQTAAKAVVRIETAGEAATGSFISATGLLLTNNHVLGVDVCAVEGCYPQLTFKHQRGEAKQAPITVFAVPVAVDVGLDMAVVQVYLSKGGAQLVTPDFLTLESHTAPALVGRHVTIVGHPESRLKKWTAGEVVDTDGDWIWTTAYTLPGDSGSPILNDAGKMVGILHRGPTSQDLFTSTGVNTYSIGTASASLIAAMKAPLPAAMISLTAGVTPDAVVAHDRVYLNAHVKTVAAADFSTIDPLGALGAACDVGLARTNYDSPEDLSSALAPCEAAMDWIECRSDTTSTVALECPTDNDATAWTARFNAMNDHWRKLNGELDLSPVTFGNASLAGSMTQGTSAGAQNLIAALAEAKAPLDLGIATYLAAFGIATYGNTSTLAYVNGYAKIPDYQRDATHIASAAVWMANNGMMTRDASIALVAQLAGDPQVDVGSKLYIEDLQYDSGLIQ